MTFSRLSEYFSQLEATTLRNKMVVILASLFEESDAKDIGKLAYLLQGRVAPLFEAIEFGMADKMMMRAIALGMGIKSETVLQVFKKEGDLGKAVEKLKIKKSRPKADQPLAEKIKNTYKKLKITDVYEVLYKLATSSGAGSQEIKIKLLADLIKEADPLSAKYIVRITLAKLRLGFSDMTMLDALSWMLSGTKEYKAAIEKAYNVRPDLGFICNTIKTRGMKGLVHVVPKVGTPILMARAERLSTAEEIIAKVGKCAVEGKLDGFRLQVHFIRKLKAKMSNVKTATQNLNLFGDYSRYVKLFSRNLEDVTVMYPDIVEGVITQVQAKEAIFEGEAIAFNPKTGEYLPFQETVQRKRKYDIAAMAQKVPLKLIVFDLLYLDGISYIDRPFHERRIRLEKTVH